MTGLRTKSYSDVRVGSVFFVVSGCMSVGTVSVWSGMEVARRLLEVAGVNNNTPSKFESLESAVFVGVC